MFKFHQHTDSPNLSSTPKVTSDNKKSIPSLPQSSSKNINFIGVTASLVALACLFIPFMTLVTLKSSTNYTFIHHPRYKLLIIPITVAACLYLLKQQRIAYIVSTIHFVLLIYEAVPIVELSKNLEPYSSYISGNLTYGFYLLIVSSFVMMLAPFINKHISKGKV